MREEKRSALGAAALAVVIPSLVVLATGLLLAGLQPQPFCGSPSACAVGQEFNVEHIIAPWVAMWNSYDLSQVDRIFLADDRVTYFSSEKEGLVRGIAALREHHAGFGFVPGGKKEESKLWVDNLHSRTFGETAVVTGRWYFQRTGTPGLIQRGPFTFVYVKNGSEFRIVHGHFSNAPEPKSPN
jgi:ketosteroid isomerase-like protein